MDAEVLRVHDVCAELSLFCRSEGMHLPGIGAGLFPGLLAEGIRSGGKGDDQGARMTTLQVIHKSPEHVGHEFRIVLHAILARDH